MTNKSEGKLPTEHRKAKPPTLFGSKNNWDRFRSMQWDPNTDEGLDVLAETARSLQPAQSFFSNVGSLGTIDERLDPTLPVSTAQVLLPEGVVGTDVGGKTIYTFESPRPQKGKLALCDRNSMPEMAYDIAASEVGYEVLIQLAITNPFLSYIGTKDQGVFKMETISDTDMSDAAIDIIKAKYQDMIANSKYPLNTLVFAAGLDDELVVTKLFDDVARVMTAEEYRPTSLRAHDNLTLGYINHMGYGAEGELNDPGQELLALAAFDPNLSVTRHGDDIAILKFHAVNPEGKSFKSAYLSEVHQRN